MAPMSSFKDKSFTFTLSSREHEMLTEVAAAENRSAANWIRSQIAKAHEGMTLTRDQIRVLGEVTGLSALGPPSEEQIAQNPRWQGESGTRDLRRILGELRGRGLIELVRGGYRPTSQGRALVHDT
jgi:hypothetical protein